MTILETIIVIVNSRGKEGRSRREQLKIGFKYLVVLKESSNVGLQ